MPRPMTNEVTADGLSNRPEAQFGIGKLFGVIPDAVIIGAASTGRVVVWNKAAAATFGYQMEEGPGLLIEELVPDSMRSAHQAGIGRLDHGEPTPLLDSESAVELKARRRDGSELWVELRLAHITGPGPDRFALAIIRDITARREAEELRARALRELEEVRLELEERNSELDRVSRTDHLTGLWNRRHVEEHLDMALSASRRHRRPLSLLLLDVDEFKAVNTRYGHQAGDVVLHEVSRRLDTAVRTEDVLGRWGGEEFLVVLPDTTTDAAMIAADRLREAVAAAPVPAGDDEIAVTISIGVAETGTGNKDGLLADADTALSRAKRLGRNRCSTSLSN